MVFLARPFLHSQSHYRHQAAHPTFRGNDFWKSRSGRREDNVGVSQHYSLIKYMLLVCEPSQRMLWPAKSQTEICAEAIARDNIYQTTLTFQSPKATSPRRSIPPAIPNAIYSQSFCPFTITDILSNFLARTSPCKIMSDSVIIPEVYSFYQSCDPHRYVRPIGNKLV